MIRIGLVGRHFDAAAAAFVMALARRARVFAPQAGDGADAWLLCDPSAGEMECPREEPLVVWLSRPAASTAPASAITVAPCKVGVAVPAPTIGFPYPGTEVARRLHLTPFLRSRWRQAARLPDEMAADLWEVESPADELLRARLLFASAVAARQDVAVEALACGAPLVTDAATASRLGLSNEGEALVVTGAGRREAMRALLSDTVQAAALSRRGRRHAERWLDQGAAADQVMAALVPAALDPAAGIVAARLDELWTMPTAGVITHAIRCLPSAAISREAHP